MPKNPKVSIVIPVYNGSNYLKEAIDSALNQSYKNIEVIVINDGSNDEGKTESIAKSYKNKIRYFKKSNGGVSTALNLGIKKMTGKYFSWLSHDDLYTRDKVKNEVAYIMKFRNNSSIVFSDFTLIDERGDDIRRINISDSEVKDIPYSLVYASPISGCTLLIPRKAFYDIGFFNLNLKTTQDYDLWLKMSKKYQFHHLKESLVLSRIHPNQDTLSKLDLHLKEEEVLYSEFLNSNTLKVSQDVLYKISLGLLEKGCFKSSRKAFKLLMASRKVSSSEKRQYFNKCLLLKSTRLKRKLISSIYKFPDIRKD